MTARPAHRIVHADRVGLDPWLLGGIAVASAVLGGVAGQVLGGRLASSPGTGTAVGAMVAVAGVLGLRSVSVRLVSRVVVAITALALVRLAVLTGSFLAAGQGTLAWVVAAIVVLVLTDRVATDAQPGMGPGRSLGDAEGSRLPVPRFADTRRGLLRNTVSVAAAVIFFALIVTPIVLPHMSRTATSGEGPRIQAESGGASVLRASDRLDMTTRPDNTDAIVFTVTADRATFWRGQTYDEWDGRVWSQSRPERFGLGVDHTVAHEASDLGAAGTDVVTQRFRFEAGYSDVVFAAASAVRVESRREVVQRQDGTLVTQGLAFGRDATYTVSSRRPVLSEARLRSLDGAIPPDIRARYAAAPDTTDRVRAAATRAAAGATTTYDKVRALETWMGSRTEYSLDAPLSPAGVDVVDHFLFQTRIGWCEQVASSLVVLARANGIPARLVTGYVPGELDRVTGTYVVRERDAHAWTEVWFPEVGWVPFDPTAQVPLAGADRADPSIGRWLMAHAVVLVLGAVAVALVVGPVAVLIRRARRRRAERPVGWVAETDARLVALGRRVEWPRSDAETATTYAASLGRRLGEPRLAEVGRAIDQILYAPNPPEPGDRARIDALLDELATAPVPTATRAQDEATPVA